MILSYTQFINESKIDLSGKKFKNVISFSDDDEFDNFYDNYLERYKVISLDKNFDELDNMNPKPKYSIYYKGDSFSTGIIYAVYDLEKKEIRTSLNINESQDDNYQIEKNLEFKQNKISELLKTTVNGYPESLKLIQKLKEKTEMLGTEELKKCLGEESFNELIKNNKIEILNYSKDMTLLK